MYHKNTKTNIKLKDNVNTITKEELEQLIAKADNKQARHWSKPTPTNTYEKGAIYYYHYEWSFDE